MDYVIGLMLGSLIGYFVGKDVQYRRMQKWALKNKIAHINEDGDLTVNDK